MMREMNDLLRILAKRNPHLWEVIGPNSPLGRVAVEMQDPIPPKVRAAHDLEHSVKDLVRQVAEAVIGASAMGQGKAAEGMLAGVVDDFCGNGSRWWPPKWPPPGPWGEEDLRQDVSALTFVQAQAALTFGYYAAGISDEKLSEAFGHCADTLAAAALASVAG
jgi:hypothetical protein